MADRPPHDAPPGPQAPLQRFRRRLGRRTRAVIVLLALLALGAQGLIEVLARPGAGEEAAINVAGRQRMLSQRIAGLALAMADGDDGARAELVAATEEFALANTALQQGAPSLHLSGDLDPATRRVYDESGGVDDRVRDLLALVDGLLAAPRVTEADTRELTTTAWGPTLAVLERAVASHEAAAVDGRSSVLSTVRWINAAILLLLVGAATLGLRPLLRRLDHIADATGRQWRDERVRRHRQQDAASVVAHELRTPTTAIVGLARTLEVADGRLDDEQVAFLHTRLRITSQRLAELLEDLTLFAGTDSDLHVEQPYPLARTLAAVAEEAGATTTALDLSPTLRATVDPHRLRMLVGEVVDNALRYGGGDCTISAGLDDDVLALAVEDEGPGLPADTRAAMLDPFVRATPVQHHGREGDRSAPGMGLAIVGTVVGEFGGEVRIPDRAQGLRLELHIPVSVEDGVVRPRGWTPAVPNAERRGRTDWHAAVRALLPGTQRSGA